MSEADNAPTAETIPFETFTKLDLRTAHIEKVEDHPKADKLYLITVRLGEGEDAERRTVVAGLKPFRKPEELEGKMAVMVTNLEPAKIRGVESQGMLLAAGGRGGVPFALLTVDTEVPPGTAVS